ncbi:hypothetical protein P692DRAFT_201799222 [Suillus brevipes Sb2]|nr:hypothetical protein P692DRAFT_201799222 [Suillus brevipes Sb2]
MSRPLLFILPGLKFTNTCENCTRWRLSYKCAATPEHYLYHCTILLSRTCFANASMRYKDNFTVCQSGTQEEYVNPPKEPKTIEMVTTSQSQVPFLLFQAGMVERTCLPTTIKFIKDHGYDIKPGDAVCIARGPEFCTKGLVTQVDFVKALSQIKVPICFVIKTCNININNFKKFLNKEVFIIGGNMKYHKIVFDIRTLDKALKHA